MADITPYRIATSDQELADLKTRLSLTRWPDKETPQDWSQGIPLDYMQEYERPRSLWPKRDWLGDEIRDARELRRGTRDNDHQGEEPGDGTPVEISLHRHSISNLNCVNSTDIH